MQTQILKYHVLIQKEGQDYIAYVPSLGISDFGKNVDQAKANVQNAILCHIEGLAKTNTEIPTPDMQEFYVSQAEVTLPKNIRLAI